MNDAVQDQPAVVTLHAFARLSVEEANDLLRPVCASPDWAAALIARRPYASFAELADESSALLASLPWEQIEVALAAHPRIGQRPAGQSPEAAWSRQEQAAATNSTTDAETDVAAALHAANVAYEQRFGFVFLICATGRSAEEILAECRRRLGNDPAHERQEVRTELAGIARLRLARVVS